MEKSDARLMAAARKGYLAGARDIIFHPGSYHEQPPEQVYQRAKQKLIELTGILREEGVAVNCARKRWASRPCSAHWTR